MPTRHGRKAVFQLDNAAGTLTDISAHVDNVDFPRPVETGETTAFGDDDKTYITGLRDATFSLSGHYDPATGAVDEHLSGILGQDATVTFEYGPGGNVTGDVKYTGEAILTSYEVTSPVGDKVSFTAELQTTGGITRTTFA